MRLRMRFNRLSEERLRSVLGLLLKARQMDGVKFRRQFSVGPYILDFYAPELKLGIELDGAHHYSYCGTKSDNLRSEYLKQNHGIYLLRFENIVIFKNTEGVISVIREAIVKRRKELSQTPPPFGHLP